MPRYFFHLADGHRDFDEAGTELENDQAAQLAAVQFAGELLRHQPIELWQKGQWRVEVTDETGVLLFTIITLAIDAPTPKQQGGLRRFDDKASRSVNS